MVSRDTRAIDLLATACGISLLTCAGTTQAALLGPTDDFNAYAGSVSYTQTDYQSQDDDFRASAITETLAQDTTAGGAMTLNEAVSRARADTGGSLGVYASITGSTDVGDTGFRKELRARSYAALFRTFRIESDTLEPGAPVLVRMMVAVHGSITWRDESGGPTPGKLGLYADAYLGIQGGTDDNYWNYFYEGDLDYGYGWEYEPGGAGHPLPPSFSDWGNFQGNATESVAADGTRTVTLDDSEVIDIAAAVGSLLYVQADMYGEAWASTPTGVHAISDFYNTGISTLEPDGPGFRMVAVVPEPTEIGLLALISLTTLRRIRHGSPAKRLLASTDLR